MIPLNLETYRPRKGDVVLLRGVIRYDLHEGNSVSVDVEGTYTTAHIKLADIAGVEKLEFHHGDRVVALGKTGVIRALRDGFAWIDTSVVGHPPFTAPIASMVRAVEQEEAPPEEIARPAPRDGHPAQDQPDEAIL